MILGLTFNSRAQLVEEGLLNSIKHYSAKYIKECVANGNTKDMVYVIDVVECDNSKKRFVYVISYIKNYRDLKYLNGLQGFVTIQSQQVFLKSNMQLNFESVKGIRIMSDLENSYFESHLAGEIRFWNYSPTYFLVRIEDEEIYAYYAPKIHSEIKDYNFLNIGHLKEMYKVDTVDSGDIPFNN